MLYLSVFGSAAGFLAYLALVARIGPERAAYTTVLSPAIALAISSLFEGYRLSAWALIGAPLILIGDVVIFAPGLAPRILSRLPTRLAGLPPGEPR